MIRCATCTACEPHNVKDQTTGKMRVNGTCHALPPIPIHRQEGLSFAFPLVNPMGMWCRMWEPRQGFNEKGERTDEIASDQPKIILEH